MADEHEAERVKAAVELVGKAFADAGIGANLQLMLAALSIAVGTTCAAFPDAHAALRAVNKLSLGIIKGVNQ